MYRDELRERLEDRFFKPFRIYLTNGAQFAVYRANQGMISTRTLALGIMTDPQQEYPDQFALIDIAHITHLEPIQTSESPSSN